MLEQKNIEIRVQKFMEEFMTAVDLPMPVAVMVHQFLPKVPEMLADPYKQDELLGLMQLMGWVIGYKVSYEDEAVEELEEVTE